MNYQRIYDEIIQRAKLRGLNKKLLEGYFERHHIVPKCMNGSNDKDNLVLLTAREHYLCHWLLTKIYVQNKKLFYAYHMLSNNSKSNRMKCDYKPRLTSKQYELMRIEFSKLTSKCHKNKIVSIEIRNKMRNSKLGIHRTDETKAKISLSSKGRSNYWSIGIKVSDETKLKLSDQTKIDEHIFGSVKLAEKYAIDTFNISKREVRRRFKSNDWPTWIIRR